MPSVFGGDAYFGGSLLREVVSELYTSHELTNTLAKGCIYTAPLRNT